VREYGITPNIALDENLKEYSKNQSSLKFALLKFFITSNLEELLLTVEVLPDGTENSL